jgi:hypothetical protein
VPVFSEPPPPEPPPSLEVFVASEVVFVVVEPVLVVVLVSGGKRALLASVLGPEDWGVGVCSGIFGGAPFTVVGVPGAGVVPGAAPGVVGVAVEGTVVEPPSATMATLGLGFALLSAA